MAPSSPAAHLHPLIYLPSANPRRPSAGANDSACRELYRHCASLPSRRPGASDGDDAPARGVVRGALGRGQDIGPPTVCAPACEPTSRGQQVTLARGRVASLIQGPVLRVDTPARALPPRSGAPRPSAGRLIPKVRVRAAGPRRLLDQSHSPTVITPPPCARFRSHCTVAAAAHTISRGYYPCALRPGRR